MILEAIEVVERRATSRVGAARASPVGVEVPLQSQGAAYGEHPYIYVKIHSAAPVLIIGDTGCDKASKHKTHGMEDCFHNPKFCLSVATRYK